jgi:hypothetical protein
MRGTDSEVIFSIEEAPEGGFVALALGYSISTEADDLAALRAAVRDASAAISTTPIGRR